jgi:hypothetical protein
VVFFASLLRFPKPQVLVYTLLMVPVVYGAAKLLSSPVATSADWSAGVATIILIPLPPLVFWAYVLMSWQAAITAATHGDVKRSKSNILRAYGSGTTVGASDAQRPSKMTQRGPATLALLGDVSDNPTLIIRDKKPEEDAFEQVFRTNSDSEDDSIDGSPVVPQPVAGEAAARPWKPRDNAAGAGGDLVILTNKSFTWPISAQLAVSV